MGAGRRKFTREFKEEAVRRKSRELIMLKRIQNASGMTLAVVLVTIGTLITLVGVWTCPLN